MKSDWLVRVPALAMDEDNVYITQASWCELMALMAVRAPTVNRDLAGAARRRAKNGHSPTIRVRCDSQLFGGWERQFTSFAGAIHNLDPPIHKLIHNFWQGMAISLKRSPFPRCLPHHLWQPKASQCSRNKSAAGGGGAEGSASDWHWLA